ncbi:MAG: hypothetical protein CMI16_03900 [Opitutaceae bacterium]|nr:hypothetical protein [Opitutaceae bacterium]|tara:strand:- start:4932 stop:5393 length:462 start_codon:yes stop_codon:yes gene_type:complete
MDKRWKVIGSFVVVFAAGAVVGSLYPSRTPENRSREWRDSANDDRPERPDFAARVMHHYSERLQLTSEQVAEIKPIVESAGKQLNEIRMGWSRNTATVAKEMNQAVIEKLTPEQKAEFEEHILRQMTERMKRMGLKGRPGMGERPPRPPPPRE